jgi:hypothetical protein
MKEQLNKMGLWWQQQERERKNRISRGSKIEKKKE